MISAKKNHFIVEFRPTAIRMARVSSHSAPAVIEDILELTGKEANDAAERVRAFAGAKSNGYVHANCAIYPQRRVLRHLLLDAAKGKETEFVINYLINNAGVDPAAYAAFCISAQDGNDAELSTFNKKHILLCGAAREDIVGVQNSLVESAVYPSRVELGTIGTIGVLKDILIAEEATSPTLYLEIDQDHTYAVIVGAKGVEMARRVDCGTAQIVTALKEEMNLKDEVAAEKILLSRDFDLSPIAPKLLRKLLKELQSSIGFFEVQTGYSVNRLYCLKQGMRLTWMENSICDLLNLTPLKLKMSDWLAQRQLTFASSELANRVDQTWFGLFSLIMSFEKGKAA